MNKRLCLQHVDHRDLKVAKGIHALQMAAYRQEAELLGVKLAQGIKPPLRIGINAINLLFGFHYRQPTSYRLYLS